MTVKLNLDPEVESRITAQANASGMAIEEYLQSLIKRAAQRDTLGAATLALFDAWEAEDETNNPEEIKRRQQEFEEFMAAMNANRGPGERVLFP